MRTVAVQAPMGHYLTVTLPSLEDIQALRVGHVAPGCFRESRVVEIYGRGTDIHGKAFVCYYNEDGPSCRISYSLKEDELDRNFSLCMRFTSAQLDELERQARHTVAEMAVRS